MLLLSGEAAWVWVPARTTQNIEEPRHGRQLLERFTALPSGRSRCIDGLGLNTASHDLYCCQLQLWLPSGLPKRPGDVRVYARTAQASQAV